MDSVTITNSIHKDVFPCIMSQFEEKGITIFFPRIFYMKLDASYITVLIKSPEIPLDDIKSEYKLNPIFVDDNVWELAKFYYQFDGWGETLSYFTEFIIHRNYKTIHLKFNPTGLYAWYGSIRKPVAEQIISKDPREIAKWMGIDYDFIMDADGIYEPKDLIEIIYSSYIFKVSRLTALGLTKYTPYIDPDTFGDSNKLYRFMINELNKKPINKPEGKEKRETLLQDTDIHFGTELDRWLKLFEFNWKLNRMARHKFNGYALWQKTGIGGGPLRQQMYHFRRQKTKYRWAEYIFNTSIDTILEDFDQFSKPTQLRIEEFNRQKNTN